MRRNPGDQITPILLPAIDGSTFDTDSLRGKPYLLSFLRFAGCPFCNLRIHMLVNRFDELGNDFAIVAIFDSSVSNLKHHADRHESPFPILADEDNRYYREYGIEHSVAGMWKGMIFRMPTLLKAMLKGYLPTTFKGSLTTMPADFLIDRTGVIQVAFYAKDEGEHLPFEEIKTFALRI